MSFFRTLIETRDVLIVWQSSGALSVDRARMGMARDLVRGATERRAVR